MFKFVQDVECEYFLNECIENVKPAISLIEFRKM
jgi:hypothetical protein